MKLDEIKIGEQLMCDIYGKVVGIGVDLFKRDYVKLEVYRKDKSTVDYFDVPPEWCWRLEAKEQVSPNQAEETPIVGGDGSV